MLKKLYPLFTRTSYGHMPALGNLPKSFFTTNVRDKIKRERQERMKATEQYYPVKSFNDLSLIRNFGIIAHIDAGKTTTTERMLYYAGALAAPGEVHDGTTVMDYMEQERNRGITIRAAAITFSWDNHQFNLIDTPGHIDFNAEVERSLRVLDGAVAIFDAVHGVQTQSEIVWLQANKFKVPRIVFINKMDRAGASVEGCVESMKHRLNIEPFVLQYPLGSAETFTGVIDLVNMTKITWKDELGDMVEMEDLSTQDPVYEKAKAQREKLIDSVASFDDAIANDFLDGKEIEATRLERAIREILIKHPSTTCVAYLGSSLKNKGVQPLLDGVIKYLPSPNERDPVLGRDLVTNREVLRYPKKDDKLCALAFKVVNDVNKGPLVYVRIYSGILVNRSQLYNVTRNVFEKSTQIFRVRADEYVGVNGLHAGDIAAIQGLKIASSGDTLIDSKDDEKIALQGVETPQAVFTASLEYESLKDKQAFENACQILTREDPSLSISENEETGQILVSGLGELHLEIFKDRLLSEFKLKTKLGKMKVTHRESVSAVYEQSTKLSKMLYGEPTYAHLELKIEPVDPEDLDFTHENPDTSKKILFGTNVIVFDIDQGPDFMRLYNEFKRRLKRKKTSSAEQRLEQQEKEKEVPSALAKLKVIRNEDKDEPLEEIEDEFGPDERYPLKSAPFEIINSIELAIENALQNGVLLGTPVLNTKITITGGSFSEDRSNEVVFQMCTAALTRELLLGASPVILEPVMDMEISTPTTDLPTVMNDIVGSRRGRIMEMKEEKSHFGGETRRTHLNVVIPLEETVGYSTFLRSMTKGEANFLMKFKQYEAVGGMKQREILGGNHF